MKTYSEIIDSQSLLQNITDPDWLVIDVRHDLRVPAAGRTAWQAGHIPGARFLHMDEDLSAPKTGHNGRHPLPDREQFVARLRALGAHPHTQFVIYDTHDSMMAARLWWMLRWVGHATAAVLDGGLQAWTASGGSLDAETPVHCTAGDIAAKPSLVDTVSAKDVLSNLTSRERLVVDARAPDRFRGENETLDPVGGHIPGAYNRFFRENLAEDGCFKPAATLRTDFEALLQGRTAKSVIAQCGSGVTACHNLLAMEIAGLPGAALYPGSWSEWCSDPARPVATGM